MNNPNQNITLEVEGMTCFNCALGITRNLKKKGLENINVNFATGEASFVLPDKSMLPKIISDINNLGYKVIQNKSQISNLKSQITTIEKKFYFSLIFTVPLFVSHFTFHISHLLNHPITQLFLCIPVFILGLIHFGKSAFGSIKSGVPNMDVLIIIGISAAFFYSLTGTILFYGTHEIHNYIFFETAATITSLVLLGNVLEHRSVKQTTTAIGELTKMQVAIAKKIIIENNHEHIQEINFSEIKTGDILLVNNGDKIPVDGKIIFGNALVDEAMLTGESVPVEKSIDSKVIGGTILIHGSIKMIAEKVGSETVLSQIIELVKNAQQQKPNIQKFGDKVSAVFVPVVLGISFFTFLISNFLFQISIQQALMNSIAVLVISCPCAMGLATPTAVMVGIGRAARNGILIKGGNTIEELAKIKTIVFDKTGTLTTGEFQIKKINCFENYSETEIATILFSLEQHSSHPIAKSIVSQLPSPLERVRVRQLSEEKGLGIIATDFENNNYKIGSFSITKGLTEDNCHSIYLIKNEKLIATVGIQDEIKSGAKELIISLKSQKIKTVLLSGDIKSKCDELVLQLNIDEVYSEQLPQQKLELIDRFVSENPTAMVGDGINDAPALARATVGISLSNATQVAIQSAQIILLNGNDLSKVNEALQISKHTVLTIKQNLFWAFFYNVVAIPIAAMGLLNPMIGALAMAFSDVIVIGNSIRLKIKNIQ